MKATKILIPLVLILILGAAADLKAQILPPNLICVNNDTLVWELPVNDCGPFISYVILASQDINGPYSVLASISDESQDFYFHEDAGNNTWYYYMESNYACPGENPFSSDTLDNRIPEGRPINYVSVNDTEVEISWEASPSPEVFAYVISRNTPTGTTIIDTVYNSTTYTDLSATPDERPETYFVVALDRCGNKSLVGDPHTTMFLEETGVDVCEQAIDMAWNAYQNWPAGAVRHEVLLSVEGGAFEVIDTIPGSATTYRFDQANDNENYCFVIRAVSAANVAFTSTSSTICTSVDITQPIRELVIANATFTPDGGAVEVTWRWNDNAELSEANLLRSTDGSDNVVASEIPVAPPLSADNSYTDMGVAPTGGPYFYQVQTTDLCGDDAVSNVVPTIFLTATAMPDMTNTVTWTGLANENASEIIYELFRETAAGTEQVATNPAGDTLHIDAVDVNDPDQTAACYYVEAAYLMTYPDGSVERLRTRSNKVCVEQVAQMYIPNAFSPTGVNTEFKPILPFGDPMDYSMIIYDRWGSQIFETRNIDDGWDGTKRGTSMPQGAYLYYIKWTTADGQTIERAGTVNLIR